MAFRQRNFRTAVRRHLQVRVENRSSNPPTFEGRKYYPLYGVVEAEDETYIGGKRPGKRGRGAAGKTPVMTTNYGNYGCSSPKGI